MYSESEILSIYDNSQGTFLLDSINWPPVNEELDRLMKFCTHIDNPHKWSQVIIYATSKKMNFNFSNAKSSITRVNDDRWCSAFFCDLLWGLLICVPNFETCVNDDRRCSEFFCDHLWGLSICVPNFISLALQLQEVNL